MKHNLTDIQINDIIEKAEQSKNFKIINEIALFNQEKVLNALQKNRICARHFAQTNGYGYDDIGRDSLNRVFADIFGSEMAIVSPTIASGTHALTLAFFGILRPNDTLISITGKPYDTLDDVIKGKNNGSLADFGIKYEQIDLLNNEFDVKKIAEIVKERQPKVIFMQRSRGYQWRKALSIAEITSICKFLKEISPLSTIIIDNCYGEFTQKLEPTECGVDLAVGSMIKNPGGGLAPTGGYICGKKAAVEQVANRLTAPSIGTEIGSYAATYQVFYQGLFLAPSVVSNALKSSLIFGYVFDELGYQTLPKLDEEMYDIIRSIVFKTSDELIKFIQTIQAVSPIDSNVTPYPWDMPGYSNQVIMAAGTFVQGASIELSADSPIVKPYIAYLQGALTYEHAKIALLRCLKA